MHNVNQRNVGDDRRQEGVLHDLDKVDTNPLDHDESGSAHHRRRQLAVGRGSNLNGARLLCRKARALHQRNGEGTRGHDVGKGGAGNQACHGRGNNRRLGRAAPHMANQCDRKLGQVDAGAGLVHQGTEQHEQEDEGGRYTNPDPEHAFLGDPEVGHRLLEGCPLPRNDVRPVLAEEDVDEEDHRDGHQRHAKRAPGSLQQQHKTNTRRHNVRGRRDSHAAGEIIGFSHQIKNADRGDDREQPVRDRHAAAR